LKHSDLVAKSGNLSLEGRTGLKRGGNEREQCDENGTHPEKVMISSIVVTPVFSSRMTSVDT
jgi:hypothetical protein